MTSVRTDGLAHLPGVARELKAAGVRTVIVAGTDTHGLLRGKRVSIDRLPEVVAHGLPVCEVIWTLPLDEVAPVDRPGDFAGWFPEAGFPDILAKPDVGTLRERSWEHGTGLLLCDFEQADGTPLSLCPRSILRSVVARAQSLGFETLVGVELECYVLQGTATSVRAKHPAELLPIDPAPRVYGVSAAHRLERFARRLHDTLIALAVPVQACHPEAGPGQLEVTIGHAPPVEAADRAVLLKHAAKALAADEGLVATFMAKPRSDWPGNSCHIHVSARTGARDAFYTDPRGRISPALGSFIAGIIDHMDELTAIMAPTVNSYRRYVPHSWASTTKTWSIDNRSAGLRAVCEGEDRARLEHRQAGGDVNPYLAIAACLAGGVDGMQRQHRAPPPAEGDLYASASASSLPGTLAEALPLLQSSELAKDWLGVEFVSHFTAMQRAELAAHAVAVTDWEIARYLLAL